MAKQGRADPNQLAGIPGGGDDGQRFRIAFANAPIGMALVSPEGRWLQVNHALCDLTGYRLDHLLATTPREITHPEDVAVDEQRIRQMLEGRLRSYRREKRLVRRDGTDAWVNCSTSLVRGADGTPQYLILQATDITDRKEAEAILHHRALHDALTGLPNRPLLMDRLGHALARRHRDGTTVALLFCDLDHFKQVNDSLGHEAGDDLLVEFARRLVGIIRPGDTAARIGGDEFVLLCERITGPEQVVTLARRVQEEMARPCLFAGREVPVTVSIGLVLAGVSDRDPEALLRNADAALYRSKQLGRARFEVFDETLRRETGERRRLEAHLRAAVDDQRLSLEYLPVVDLGSGTIEGAEALLRWDHPTLGPLQPNAFLDVAEDSGLILPVGQWALRQACADAASWQRLSSEATVAVNLSPRQLLQPALVEVVTEIVAETGLAIRRLRIDVPEAAISTATGGAARNLLALRRLGLSLALDDFGTGESSLTALQRTGASVVKIDSSLVGALGRDDGATRLVRALLHAGRSMGVQTLAEGVETPAQAERLATMGCDLAQGYLFGRPVGSAALVELLDKGTRSHDSIARSAS